jgi:hypothetical protein
MKDEKISTAYINIFLDKSKKQRQRIEEILLLPKQQRDRKLLKRLLKDNKELRILFKKIEKSLHETTCPKCGHSFQKE